MTTETRLFEIIARVLGLPKESLIDSATMKEIETWDSLKHMELIVTLEAEFETQLSYEEIVNMKSIGDIKRIMQGKVG